MFTAASFREHKNSNYCINRGGVETCLLYTQTALIKQSVSLMFVGEIQFQKSCLLQHSIFLYYFWCYHVHKTSQDNSVVASVSANTDKIVMPVHFAGNPSGYRLYITFQRVFV